MHSLWQLLLVLIYPGLVYLCLERGGVRLAAAAVGALLIARIVLIAPAQRRALPRAVRVGLALGVAMSLGAGLLDAPLPLLLLPVAVSAIGLFVFGSSLLGVPLIEQLARRQRPDLLQAEVRYCRTVTIVWCGFFSINAVLSLVLALRGPISLWTLYTGLLAYLIIATLFVGEWFVRRMRFGTRAPTPLDALLRRVRAVRLR